MNVLMLFVAAMTGPANHPNCHSIRFVTTVCTRSVGETVETCITDESLPAWTCRGFDPHWFSLDRDHDGDVDLRDWAKVQNTWGEILKEVKR